MHFLVCSSTRMKSDETRARCGCFRSVGQATEESSFSQIPDSEVLGLEWNSSRSSVVAAYHNIIVFPPSYLCYPETYKGNSLLYDQGD